MYLFSGEFYEEAIDFRILSRGIDFVWARKYRSKVGLDTEMGNGWTHSYDISIQARGSGVILRDGWGRSDFFALQGGGSYTRREFFIEGRKNPPPDDTYDFLFPDGGRWRFRPLDGKPGQGKIQSITDRNGNAMSFSYDVQGRLVTITDTLGRPIVVAYDGDGFLASVTDFAGRTVTYSYYQDGDAGGGAGDLATVTTPAVVGTPNGNDFPLGKTTTYTYSKGFADERLNHNLLTITDPKGQLHLTNTYGTTDPPGSLEYDRVTRQVWGDSGDILNVTYWQHGSSPRVSTPTLVATVNDRVGNVSDYHYGARNRLVMLRRYTGRADPDQPTTPTENRPENPLRSGDPAFFDVSLWWNSDSLVKRIVYPEGNDTRFTYEPTLNPGASILARGNVRKIVRRPGPRGGDQPSLTELLEYDPLHNLLLKHTDAKLGDKFFTRDVNGNLTQIQHRIPTIVEGFEYNAFGQLTAHVAPDNGSGINRRDELTYFAAPQAGYLQARIVDALGFALTTTYAYDLVGNVTQVTDPRGNYTSLFVNAQDQVVSVTSRAVSPLFGTRYELDLFYDANDNMVRVDVQNVDEKGIVVAANPHFTAITDFDVLNHAVRTCRETGSFNVLRSPPQLDCSGLPEAEFLTTEYAYDENRNRTLVLYGEAVEARDPANEVGILYDERDLLYQVVRAPTDPGKSTTQVDYDGNGNQAEIFRGLEGTPRVTMFHYDGYDRKSGVEGPMGNLWTCHYDANHNRTSERTDGELVDVAGNGGNIRLSEKNYVHDALNRLIRVEIDFFDPATGNPFPGGQVLGKSITDLLWSDSSQLTQIVDDNLHATSTSYDTANRPSTRTDAKGNTVTYAYDANSNVTSVTEEEIPDLGGASEVFVTTYVYDGLDRLNQTVDNVGNANAVSFDSRDNPVERVDALKNVVRHAYDGINRETSTTRLLTDDGTGSGNPIGSIVTTQIWDDSDRLTVQGDDHGNLTQYAYDALNRRVGIDFADGTTKSFGYDVHDNRLTSTDANGSVVASTYDLLNRAIGRAVTPGAGISNDTTFEAFLYDGLSRLVVADDDDSSVLRAHDSLSNVRSETQNGRTVTSVFDGLGNKLSCTYPSGRTIVCVYDDLNRKVSIGDPAALATYAYSGPARVVLRTYPPVSVESATTYDAVKRITGTSHTNFDVVDDRTYQWDAMYNKTRRADVRGGGPQLTHDYLYDSAYRLIRATVLDPLGALVRDTTYELDGVGNRQSVSGAASCSGDYAMDPTLPEPADFQLNQYTSTPCDARTQDQNGNLTQISVAGEDHTMTYDYRNRMVAYSNDQDGSYAYDALGRRIARTVIDEVRVTETTLYFYDGWQVCEERDGSNGVLATTVYGIGPDEVVNRRSTSGDYYFCADDLGSVMAVKELSAGIVERYEYDDYGAPASFDGAGTPIAESAIGNPYLFTGRRFDPESGWYYYRTRYLDPEVGRFTTRDTIGIWGDSMNLGNGQTYAGNNPQTYADPSGRGIEPQPFQGGIGALSGVSPDPFRLGIGAVSGVAPQPFRLGIGALSGVSPEPFRLGIGAVSGVEPQPFRLGIGALSGVSPTPFRLGIGAVSGISPQPFRLGIGALSGVEPTPFRLGIGAVSGISPQPFRLGIGALSGIEPEPFRLGIGAVSGVDPQPFRLGIGALSGISPEPFRLGIGALSGIDPQPFRLGIGAVSGVDPTPFRLGIGALSGIDPTPFRLGIGALSGIDPNPFRLGIGALSGISPTPFRLGIGALSGVEPEPFRLGIGAVSGIEPNPFRLGIGALSGISPTPFR